VSDPRDRGARCDVCPLATCRQGGPVMAEDNPGAWVAIVGDFPGDTEVREGRPFVGPAANEATRALTAVGVKRGDAYWTTTVACQPPGSDMKRLLAQIQSRNAERKRENTQRAKDGYPALALEPSPIDCCRPRLASELARFDRIITMGSVATKGVTGAGASILDLRGGMMAGRLHYDAAANTLRIVGVEASEANTGGVVKLMPTLSPGFVQRSPKWTVPFRTDVGRASRWFRGVLAWHEPRVVYQPTPEQLAAFILRPGAVLAYDYETDGIEPLSANVRCIGIGDADEVHLVGILAKDGVSRFYTPSDEARIHEVLKAFFAHPHVIKVGHNAGSYDRMVVRTQYGIDPMPTLDTILLHRLVESELPHNLAFVGSVYTDIHAWKTDREGRKLAFDSETDEELHRYCALDVAVTARVMPALYDATKVRTQDHLIACDHAVQRICADMHTVGMFVDQEARAVKEKSKLREVLDLRASLRDASGVPDLNPGSTHALRRLLFGAWKLEPPIDDDLRFTGSGDPSTDDNVIRGCLMIPGLTDQQRAFLKTLRNYRSAQKELGTYIVKLRPMSDAADGVGWDEDESDEERNEREKRGYVKRGIVWPDGRMRPGYNAHVTVSGRLSSSKPINAQNFPKGLRSMVRAQPGHVLVGADADQLELRIAAARWGCKLYLDAFDAGADPHSMTAMAVFGDRFAAAKGFPEGDRTPRPGDRRIPFLFAPTGKWAEDAYRMRNLAKMVQYASQYGGAPETVLRLLQLTEDENGELVYLNLSLREVRLMHQAWLEGAKEFARGWDQEVAFFRANGYIAEPVMGRRRDCLDGEDMNAIVNFPIQGAASSLINRAMIRIADAIPLHKWGPGTGLITQTHDALVVECPQDTASFDPETKKWTVPEGSIPWRVQRIIEEAMNQTDPSLPGVRFTATADVGLTWKEVG
jgi:DNA polymerase I-like protein with 3'-5' exonuclease and polymerase domains/uracil-DNA glycosylase